MVVVVVGVEVVVEVDEAIIVVTDYREVNPPLFLLVQLIALATQVPVLNERMI